MGQAARVQRFERIGQRNPEPNRFLGGEMLLATEIALQRARLVMSSVDLAAGQMVVRQFHTIIEVIARPADVQNVDKPGVLARDRLERGHSFELAAERALTLECAAVNNFYRTQCASDRARQPNLAVRAAPDHAQHFVVGNDWNLCRNFLRNDRDFTRVMWQRQFWGAHAMPVRLGPRVLAKASRFRELF